jgi:hypothetical protein
MDERSTVDSQRRAGFSPRLAYPSWSHSVA